MAPGAENLNGDKNVNNLKSIIYSFLMTTPRIYCQRPAELLPSGRAEPHWADHILPSPCQERKRPQRSWEVCALNEASRILRHAVVLSKSRKCCQFTVQPCTGSPSESAGSEHADLTRPSGHSWKHLPGMPRRLSEAHRGWASKHHLQDQECPSSTAREGS